MTAFHTITILHDEVPALRTTQGAKFGAGEVRRTVNMKGHSG